MHFRHKVLQSDPCVLAFATFSGFVLGSLASPLVGSFQLGSLFVSEHQIDVTQGAWPMEAHHLPSPRQVRIAADGAGRGAASAEQRPLLSWLRASFNVLDEDRDGSLDDDDLLRLSSHLELKPSYLSKLKCIVGEENLSFDELLSSSSWLKAQFQMIDADRDGSVDARDFERMSRRIHLSPSYAQKLRKRIGDEAMSFDEFAAKVKKLERVAASSGDGRHSLEPEHSEDVFGESISRATLLLGLMMLQSASAMVLRRYESLLKEHVVVMLFLTMLVGAGGNVGNQSVIKVIEQVISGHLRITVADCTRIMLQQMAVGSLLAVILGIGGFARAFVTQYYFRAPGDDGALALRGCVAVTAALMVIVLTSTGLGTALPLALAASGLDVAHAGPSIQVVMDIGGVMITCAIARAILTRKNQHKPT